MKNSIITMSAIIIVLGTGILISCSSNNNGANNQTTDADTSMKKSEQVSPEANKEAEESHEVDKPGGGPHKGIIEEAGEKNHIEMTMNGKDVAFYLLDELTNPIETKGWIGKAVFQYKDGKAKSIDLMLMDGALTAMDANGGKSFTVDINLSMNGQSIASKFSSEGSIEHNESDHK